MPTPYLQQLKDSGVLQHLYTMGLINPKAYLTLGVRLKVDALMRSGLGKSAAVSNVAGEMRLSVRTIYRWL